MLSDLSRVLLRINVAWSSDQLSDGFISKAMLSAVLGVTLMVLRLVPFSPLSTFMSSTLWEKNQYIQKDELLTNLLQYWNHNYEERVGEAEQEPELHRFDGRGDGEAGRHWDVDRGQHHHAGDVHSDHQVKLVSRSRE